MSFFKKALGFALPAIGTVLGGPVGGMVGGAIGSALNKPGQPRQSAQDPRMQAFDQRVNQAGQYGQDAQAEYLKRIQNFNPMAAATAANQAQYNMTLPLIKQQVADLRGSEVGMGRLDTGFGSTAEDKVLTDNYNNLNQSMIARSMDAANMQMQNNAQLGQFGNDQQNLFLDATLGRYQTDADRAAAAAASKNSMWGSLLGAGIGAFGSYLGNRKQPT